MERLKAENETTIYELLRGGLFGQMQTGDTYGLWTFDKETHAGKFPLQTFDTRRGSQLAAIAAAYLSGLNYENSDDVKRMTDLLSTVVRAVSNLNVFIISDGSSAMRGTPFDKAINTEYRKQRRQRSSAKQPFVTTLIARGGSITNYSVVVAGQPILLPERPVPTMASAKQVPLNRPAGILLSNTVVTSATVALSSLRPPLNSSAATPGPTNVTTISPSSSNAAVKAALPVTRVMQIVTKSNSVSAATEPSSPEPAKTELALVPVETQTNNTSPELSAPAPTPPVPTGVVASPLAESPAPRNALTATILPAPLTVAARELHPEPETANTAPPTTVQAAALPVPSGPGAGLFLTFGTLLMVAAFFLLFVVFRRLRPTHGGSLITQSMERR